MVSIADPVLSHLAGMKVDRARAVRLATELITKSSDRSVVKFGIVLLGAYGKAEHCELLKEIGVHEEFTFFASKAVKNLDKHASYQDKLIELGERTGGWGKISVILEFSDHTLTDETRKWILRNGCRNDIALHFTACECAIKGSLGEYIQEVVSASENDSYFTVDEEMTEGICDIVEGLLQGSSIKEADGVNEVPDMKNIAGNIDTALERGCFQGNEVRLRNLLGRLYPAVGLKK